MVVKWLSARMWLRRSRPRRRFGRDVTWLSTSCRAIVMNCWTCVRDQHGFMYSNLKTHGCAPQDSRLWLDKVQGRGVGGSPT